MTELTTIIDTLDNAADGFDATATKAQKKMFDEVLTLIKDLDTDSLGKVKQTIQNLKRLTQIKAHLAALSKDKDWVAGIGKFASYFDILQKQQVAYFSQHFPEATLTETAKKKHAMMKQLAVQNTMEALIGDGLKANVTDKLNDILLRAVTTNAKFADLQEELRAHLLGKDGGQGAFARYATTYATTAMSQFTGQNNKLLTDDLDTEWFIYTGSNKETTREFCQQLTAKRYIHRSEIPTILTGKIDDYQCAIYPKTNLPYGMIEGTTVDNFQCNCGGWNCRHQLVPVHESAVPASLRAKFAKAPTTTPEPTPEPAKLENWDEKTKNAVAQTKRIAEFYNVDASRLNNKTATQEEIVLELKRVSERISLQIRNSENKKKAAGLVEKGYQDVKINDKGGLFAVHPNHNTPKKAQKVIGDFTGFDLELHCAKELFYSGHSVILQDEGETYQHLNPQGVMVTDRKAALDSIIDGKRMDIKSIATFTQDYRNAINDKHKQIERYLKHYPDFKGRSLCLYFENPSVYDEKYVREGYKRYKGLHETPLITEIYCVVKGKGMFVFNFE